MDPLNTTFSKSGGVPGKSVSKPTENPLDFSGLARTLTSLDPESLEAGDIELLELAEQAIGAVRRAALDTARHEPKPSDEVIQPVSETSRPHFNILQTPALSLVERISQTAADLLAIPSVSSDLESCRRVANYVEERFQNTGYHVRRIVKDGVSSIVISKSRNLDFHLLFLGHLDVVPGTYRNAFQPEFRDGYLYGRGSFDMKGPCAAMIELFLENEHDPNYQNHALVFTTDEEVGGPNGVGHLVEDWGLRAKVLVNPDGGGPFSICLGEKGVIHLELEAKGKAGHGSRPWDGENAFLTLAKDLRRIWSLYDWATGEDKWKPSINIGSIHAGNSANGIPANASAKLDFRFPAGVSREGLKETILRAVQESWATIIFQGEATAVSDTDQAFVTLVETFQEFGIDPQKVRAHGASDARWFAPYGTTTLLFQPLGDNMHAPDERVSIKSLETSYNIFARFVERMSEEV